MPRLLALAASIAASTAPAAEPRHVTVFHDPATFAAWPANVGLWSWDGGREALVGFVTGRYDLRKGHNVAEPYTNRLARTTDGGAAWQLEPAAGFFQTGAAAEPLPGGLDFTAPGFALRVVAEGYQGGGPGTGVIATSTDRGKTWRGPFALPDLLPAARQGGRDQLTPRTDVVVLGPGECLLMGSARPAARTKPDRSFAARLVDGGRRGEFLGWVQPEADPHRTLMSSTVKLPDGSFVSALRVRQAGGEDCWINGYTSTDGGKSWRSLGKVGDTGRHNGNPPALIALADGRLCCAYGNRSRRAVYARLSADGGKTWGAETVVRDDYAADAGGEIDFGYVRLFQRPDGDLVAVYYWATADRPTNFIAATTWTPAAKE